MDYELYLHPRVFTEIKNLPRHMRQRVKRAIDDLASHPRPTNSTRMETPNFDREARRLRLDKWRIVYVITETNTERVVDVLTVRKRPPYNYQDLAELLTF